MGRALKTSEFSLVPVQRGPTAQPSARKARLETRRRSIHCSITRWKNQWKKGCSSPSFTRLSKEKDTPFFAFLLDILHSGQSRGHTSEELEGGRGSVSASLPLLLPGSPPLPLPLLTLAVGSILLGHPLHPGQQGLHLPSLFCAPSALHTRWVGHGVTRGCTWVTTTARELLRCRK